MSPIRPAPLRPVLLYLWMAWGILNISPAAAAKPILPAPNQVSGHFYAWIGPHGGPSPANQGFRQFGAAHTPGQLVVHLPKD